MHMYVVEASSALTIQGVHFLSNKRQTIFCKSSVVHQSLKVYISSIGVHQTTHAYAL